MRTEQEIIADYKESLKHPGSNGARFLRELGELYVIQLHPYETKERK